MVFENPHIIWLLVALIPILTVLSLYGWTSKKEAIELFQLDTCKLKRKYIEKYIIYGVLLTIFLITLALPKIVVYDLSNTEKTGEIILCVDVSTSMAAQINTNTPSRLERAKTIIHNVINNLARFKSVNISLCAFTNMARSIVPFVSRKDYSYLDESINKILDVYCIPGKNTSLAQAILDVVDKYSAEAESKLLIIFSDGECFPYDSSGINWEERKLTEVAIQKALSADIKIITIGIGEQDGAKIPLFNINEMLTGEYSQLFGVDYISYLHEEELQQYSNRTNGMYYYEDNLRGLAEFIDSNLILLNMETEGKTYKSVANWFVICSFLLWLVLVKRNIFS